MTAHVNESADVCIIGGGIYGLVTAYHLVRMGCDVLIVERRSLAMESSRANAGSLGVQNKTLKMLTSTIKAAHRWEQLSEELGMDIGYERLGGFRVAHDEEDMATLQAQIPLQQQAGVPLEFMPGSIARKEAPYLGEGVKAATYCHLDGLCDPLKTNLAYARAIVRLGGRFLTNAPVRSIKFKHQHIILETPCGVISANRVVNAAGAWAGAVSEMMGIPLPITWVVNTVSITQPGPVLIRHLITHVRGNLTLKQHDGRILIGGAWRGDGDPFDGHPTPNLSNLKGNISWACQTVPGIRNFTLLRSWVGFQANSPDRLFIMGELPPYDGSAYVIAGGSGGYTLAPVIGEMMAQWIGRGTVPEGAEPYNVKRFL
jgi:glycine/D-amino acid oxidase-like deaminating enzyme